MIRVAIGMGFAEHRIPRESGDDPLNGFWVVVIGWYSPRERG